MTTEGQLRSRVLAMPPTLDVTDTELAQLDTELHDLLQRVKAKPNLEAALEDLAHLSQFQELLATMFFKYEIELTENQKFIVRNFDRGDDPDLREYFFKRIKVT